MTTAKFPHTFRLPDRPEREPDDMTNFDHLAKTSIIEPLAHYLGNRLTTLITGDKYLCRNLTRNLAGARYPDLLIAFNVDPEAHQRRNGYIIAEQGKPPDFVLEIASRRTGRVDTVDKRNDYAALGIPRILAFRRNGRTSPDAAGRRPLGTRRALSAHRHRRGGRWHSARLQPRPEPAYPLGERATAMARPGNGKAHRNFRGRAGSPPAGGSPRPRTGSEAPRPGQTSDSRLRVRPHPNPLPEGEGVMLNGVTMFQRTVLGNQLRVVTSMMAHTQVGIHRHLRRRRFAV